MHLAQMKSDERRKKILNIERHLTKDSCLCDACYRHVDRKVGFIEKFCIAILFIFNFSSCKISV